MNGSVQSNHLMQSASMWYRRGREFLERNFKFNYLFMVFVIINVLVTLETAKKFGYLGVPLTSDANRAIETWGASDAGSYLRAGKSFFESGGYNADTKWIQIFWAPGMPLLWFISIKVFGLGGNIIVGMLIIQWLSWALALSLLCIALSRWISKIQSLIVVLALMMTALYSKTVFGHLAIYPDGISSATLISALASIAIGINSTHRLRWMMSAGFFIACSAYFRGQYFLIVQALTFSAVAVLIVILILSIRSKDKLRNRLQSVLPLFVVALMSAAICAPNIAYRAATLGVGDASNPQLLSWTAANEIIAIGAWNWPEKVYFKGSGDGAACYLDPVQCDEIHRIEGKTKNPYAYNDPEGLSGSDFVNRMMWVYITNPIEFAKFKVPLFVKYWYSEPSLSFVGKSAPLFGTVSFTGFLASLVLAFLSFIKFRKYWLLGLIYLGLMVGLLAPPFISHFEPRYLVAAQFCGFITALTLLFFSYNKLLPKIKDRHAQQSSIVEER